MIPYPLRAELAFIHLLNERASVAPGPVDLLLARSEWPRYGLRETDLPPAMDRLLGLGLIGMNRARNRTLVVLTELGRDWLQSQEALVAQMLLLPRDIGRGIERWRYRVPASPAASGRRSTDRTSELS